MSSSTPYFSFRRAIRFYKNLSVKSCHVRQFSGFKLHNASATEGMQAELKGSIPTSMSALQVHDFGGIESLILSETRVPVLINPNDVLVRVKAASLNPLDIAMTEGYGQTTINTLKKLRQDTRDSNSELPLTPGRDFSGEVAAVGRAVTNFKVGDEVYGVVSPQRPGSHAEYTLASSDVVLPKPVQLTHTEAAAIPYAGLTAWSALKITGELCTWSSKTQRVLVLGGSGGVGVIAIQLLKAWHHQVYTTCGPDSILQCTELGADGIVDYTAIDAEEQLKIFAGDGFDVILDLTGQSDINRLSLLKSWANAKYVTLSSPLLKDVDKHGLLGVGSSVGSLLANNVRALTQGKTFRWGFYMPSSAGFQELDDMVNDGKVRPVIAHVYPFDQACDAYLRAKEGHTQGKLVLSME